MAFTEVFGNSPQVRLLDFLADHVDFDYTITQLSELAGISRPALYRLVDQLAEESLLTMTRKVGDSRFYRLNLDNPKVLSMLRVDFSRTNDMLQGGKFAEAERSLAKSLAAPRSVARARAPRAAAVFSTPQVVSVRTKKGRRKRGRRPFT